MEPNLFFDLDGTLCNSEEGILNAVCYAIDRLGLPPQERGQLRHFIGPPLSRTFAADYGLSPEAAQRAVDTYREYYNARGIFECCCMTGFPSCSTAFLGQVTGWCLPPASQR